MRLILAPFLAVTSLYCQEQGGSTLGDGSLTDMAIKEKNFVRFMLTTF